MASPINDVPTSANGVGVTTVQQYWNSIAIIISSFYDVETDNL